MPSTISALPRLPDHRRDALRPTSFENPALPHPVHRELPRKKVKWRCPSRSARRAGVGYSASSSTGESARRDSCAIAPESSSPAQERAACRPSAPSPAHDRCPSPRLRVTDANARRWQARERPKYTRPLAPSRAKRWRQPCREVGGCARKPAHGHCQGVTSLAGLLLDGAAR